MNATNRLKSVNKKNPYFMNTSMVNLNSTAPLNESARFAPKTKFHEVDLSENNQYTNMSKIEAPLERKQSDISSQRKSIMRYSPLERTLSEEEDEEILLPAPLEEAPVQARQSIRHRPESRNSELHYNTAGKAEFHAI
jgi:hypothetical protein